MKKLLIIIPLALVLLVVGFVGYFMIRVRMEVATLHPVATGELTEGVYTVEDDFSNLYLVKNGDSYIAIDAAKDAENVKAQMETLKIDPLKVTTVLLTHSDSDHVGALELFSNAEVYISEAEEQMVNGETARALFLIKNSLEDYKTFKAGETLNIDGLQVETIATPGHTPGSVCYLINGNLFTGDNMSLTADGKAGPFNDFFNMDSKTQKESIKILAQLKEVDYIFTGHHGYTSYSENVLVYLK